MTLTLTCSNRDLAGVLLTIPSSAPCSSSAGGRNRAEAAARLWQGGILAFRKALAGQAALKLPSFRDFESLPKLIGTIRGCRGSIRSYGFGLSPLG